MPRLSKSSAVPSTVAPAPPVHRAPSVGRGRDQHGPCRRCNVPDRPFRAVVGRRRPGSEPRLARRRGSHVPRSERCGAAAPRPHGPVRTLEVLLVAAGGIGGAFGGLRLYDTLQQHPGAARAGSPARHDGLPGYTSIRPLLWPALLAAEEAPDQFGRLHLRPGLPGSPGVAHPLARRRRRLHVGRRHRHGVEADPDGDALRLPPLPVDHDGGQRPQRELLRRPRGAVGQLFRRWRRHPRLRPRAYGFAQSLGCVELPVAHAAVAWRWIHYGTVVTVLPGPHSTPAT